MLGLGLTLAMSSTGCDTGAAATQPAGAIAGPADWFADTTLAAGIDWKQGHGGRSPLTVLETTGSGCAVEDFDGDDHLDILLVGQADTGNTGRCALYRGSGDGRFTEATKGSGLEEPAFYLGCMVGDLDNDGRPDLLLTGYGELRLFRNEGGMRFREVDARELRSPDPTTWHTSATFGDIDNDGLLDIYVGAYVIYNETTQKFCDYGGVKASCGPKFYDPLFGRLYRNLGGMRFKDVTTEWGLTDQHGKCLGAAFADVNDDGWIDLYLGNDEMPGDLYINQAGRRFVNRGVDSGVALSFDGQMQGAMGVDFADFNRDGLLDLFVTTYEFEPASLYLNEGSGSFRYGSMDLGIDSITRPMVGFGTRFVDVDNDGWLDIAVANGHIHDNHKELDSMNDYRQPMQLFMSDQGRRLVDRSKEAGHGFLLPAVGRGLATGDFNEDGKVDLLMTDLESSPRLLINRSPSGGNWLRVGLTGSKANRDGIGAKLVLTGPDGARWTAECARGGSYLSSSEPVVHFGLGDVTKLSGLEVRWPGGGIQQVSVNGVNRLIQVKESR